MNTKSSSKRDVFDSPSIYEICVQGVLPAEWSSRLEGMAIVTRIHEDGVPVTTLTGDLADQAALAGVLDHLYSLRLPVLSVMRFESKGS
jgi:hypothetical protein